MKLTKEEGRQLLWDDLEDWEKVEEKICDTTRWSIVYRGIFKNLTSYKYYCVYWSVGATEQQDEQPFEYDDPELVEVEPYDKLIKDWRSVKKKTKA
jgi:hypothetical protein